MRILIAEDETFIAENLAAIVRNAGHEVVALVDDKLTFSEYALPELIDIALLDIRMHGEDLGYFFADYLRARQIPFVFITSFADRETLKDAVSFRPYGFITKPFSKDEILLILSQLESEIRNSALLVKTGNEYVKIRKEDIQYLKSENVYVTIYTEEDRIVIRAKLTDICANFTKNEMLRVHQSFAVNPKFIMRFSETEVILNNAMSIPISRKYQLDVKEVLTK